MNRIFVLKDVQYGAKVGGGVITDVNEVNLLAPGALAFFSPRGILLTAGNAAANVADVKEIIMASGRVDDNQLVGQVPRLLQAINRADYRAFIKPTETIFIMGIPSDAEGDMSIRVTDISYTSKTNIRLLTASEYKRPFTSVETTLEKLVAKLNKPSSYVTAELVDLVGVAEEFTIEVTLAATVAGNATVDINGITTQLPLTASTVAINADEIASTINGLLGWTATSDGVDTVTAVAVDAGDKADVANYTAGTATTSAASLVTTVQGIDSLGTYTIAITPKEEGVSIELSVDGLLEGSVVQQTVTPVYGIGRDIDILQMERDFSTEEGNGNYIDYTAEWYSRTMETVTGENYDLITSTWQGQHNTPTQLKNVMHNRTVIACVNGAGNGQAAGNISLIMSVIFGNAYTTLAGTVTGLDDGTNYDGIPGN